MANIYERAERLLKLPAAVQTDSEEVAESNHTSSEQEALCLEQRVPYSCISRLIDVCCIADILRNFPISSLIGDEIERFEDLQSFFFDLESRCLYEAGIE